MESETTGLCPVALDELAQVSTPQKPTFKQVGDDPAVWFLTNRMTFLATAEETSSAYSLVHTLTQCNGTPPPHIHSQEDEAFYMVRGLGRFLVGTEVFEASPGSVTYLPRGVAHAPVLLSEDAEVLILVAPGGFSEFFRQQSIPATTSGLPTLTQAHMPMVENILSLGQEFGLTFLPPGAAVASWPVPESQRPPVHLNAGEGDLQDFLGARVKIKLEASQTQGLFSMFELEDEPGFQFPEHQCRHASEAYYVLDGSYEFMVEGEIRQAAPGSFVYAPANTWIGYRNCGRVPGKILVVTASSGHEAFFRAAHSQARNLLEPIAHQHGIEFSQR